MRNCGKIKRKKTKLDRMMDRLVITVSVVQTPLPWPAGLPAFLTALPVGGCLLG